MTRKETGDYQPEGRIKPDRAAEREAPANGEALAGSELMLNFDSLSEKILGQLDQEEISGSYALREDRRYRGRGDRARSPREDGRRAARDKGFLPDFVVEARERDQKRRDIDFSHGSVHLIEKAASEREAQRPEESYADILWEEHSAQEALARELAEKKKEQKLREKEERERDRAEARLKRESEKENKPSASERLKEWREFPLADEEPKEELPETGSEEPMDSVKEFQPEENQDRESAKKEKRIPLIHLHRGLITVLLVMFMAFLFVGMGFFVYLMRGRSFSHYVLAYDSAREYQGTVSEKENLRAEPFAEKLCVVEGDIALDGVDIPPEQGGLLMDISNRRTMFAQKALDRLYPASVTKLVTAILALQYGGMEEKVTITPEDLNLEEGAQVCGFWVGDTLTMNQLLHCLLVYSGNDAASAIAHHVGGTISNFVDMMNSYAVNLGCTGTHFVNPHGLQDENHYTTAYDIYLMLKEAAKYPAFTEISQMGSYTVEYQHSDGTEVRTLLEATDHYLTGEAVLPKNVTVLGGKTGTTYEAGNCLALLTLNAFGQAYVSIIMGAPEKEMLYDEMNMLLEKINGE